MITYNDLYEMLRKERYSEQLQVLPRSFLEDVAGYFEEKKQTAVINADVFSDSAMKAKKQFENAVGLFKELMLRRRKKLITLAFVASETGISKRDFENMLDFEKELFDRMIKSIESAEKSVSEFLNGKKSESRKSRMIFFKEDVDEFLGMDGGSIGPFKKGELANLPEEIADILKSDNKADFVDESA